MFEKKIRVGNLFVFYGQLLTYKQQEILNYYYMQDLSLGEIAENLKISRQAVYDAVKKSEKILEDYETKLDLLKKFSSTRENIFLLVKSIDNLIDDINIRFEKKIVLEEIDLIRKKAIQILEESS